MKSNIILCVLNRVFLQTDSLTGRVKLPNEELYYSEDLKASFAGIQANEAPIKMLIHEANSKGKHIDEIIYLCSDKCTEPIIPAYALESSKHSEPDESSLVSAEELFVSRIVAYCESVHIQPPTFNPLAYNPARPADSLLGLNSYLDGRYEVSIDITGGRRDAVILQVLAVQLLKLQSTENTIGSVVYSSFDDKTISRQNTTFDLIELLNAVESFVQYGRADQLNNFFGCRPFISKETMSLCASMNEFTNALALCQVGDIDKITRNVQRGFDEVESSLTSKINSFSLITAALDALDNPKGWNNEMTLEEAVTLIQSEGLLTISPDEPDDQLKGELEKARWSFTVVRSELLLYTLIPTMRKRFVPAAENGSRLIMDIIRWCSDHQMIQQALCIYRERISECLVNLGFFSETQHFKNLGSREKKEIFGELCKSCQIGLHAGSRKELFFLSSTDYAYDYNDYFELSAEKSSLLALPIAWYKYLHGIRNTIMHIDVRQEGFGYRFACCLLGRQPNMIPDVPELQQCIADALSCIEAPMSFDIESWNRAYKSAKGQPPSSTKHTPVYTSKAPAGDSYVKSVAELQMLLLAFAGESGEVEWNSFSEWCNKAHGKQLNKRCLGLDQKIAFYKGLCMKYPDKFSTRITDESIYLVFR